MTTRSHPPSVDVLLRHEAFVRGAARAVLGGDGEVDDVVQDTWLAALSGGPRDPRRTRAWLGGVARRLALLSIRRRLRARRREEDARTPAPAPSAADVAAREEARARLVRALLALQEPCRGAVLLRYYEGLMPREIARRLGVPVETVKTRIKRGLVRLRERLAEGPSEERHRRRDALAGLAGFLPEVGAGGMLAPAVALLAAIGLAAGGVLLLRDDTEAPAPKAPRTGQAEVPVARQPGLRGRALASPAPASVSDDAPTKETAAGYVGRVVDEDGLPLVGAEVRIQVRMKQRMIDLDPLPWLGFLPPPAGSSEAPHAKVREALRTDADGRFRHSGPAAVHARLLVSRDGYAPRVARAGVSMRREDGTVDFGTLRLLRGATLRAVALDSRGAALAGVTVAVQPPDGRDRQGLERDEIVRVARTDADGRVTIAGLLPGDVLVGALDLEYPATVERLRLVNGEVRDLTLRLTRGRSLRVTVRERGTGRPLARARVDVIASRPLPAGAPAASQEERTDAPLPPEARDGAAEPVRVASVRTGEDGVAALHGLPATVDAVVVVPPDLADVSNVQPPPFSVRRAPGDAQEIVFELAPVIDLPILVDAHPMPGAIEIEAHPVRDLDAAGGIPSDLRATVEIDARGEARFTGLRPGTWRMRGFAHNSLPLDVEVELEESRLPPTLTLRLEPATATAVGRIEGPDGPLAGAKVSSYEWVPWLGDGQRAEATTATDGTFELKPLLGAPRTLLVRFEASGLLGHELRIAAADRTGDLGTIRLMRPGRIVGEGAPAGGRVQATCLDRPLRGKGPAVEAMADAAGRFVLDGLAPGRWRVRAEDGAEITLHVSEGQEVPALLVR